MRVIYCASIVWLVVLFVGCETPPGFKQKPSLDVIYSGKIDGGLFTNEFVFKVWHHHPGTVHRGTVHMQATGAHINGGKPVSERFSFDAWPPNEENARTFRFDIDRIGPELRIRFDLDVLTEETGEFRTFAFWKDAEWDNEARAAEIQRQVDAMMEEGERGGSP